MHRSGLPTRNTHSYEAEGSLPTVGSLSDAAQPGLRTASPGQESSLGSLGSGDCSGDLSDRDTSVGSFPSSIGHIIQSPPSSPSSTPAHTSYTSQNDDSTPSIQGSTMPMPSPTSGGSIFDG